jgi:hypothetical protein
LVGVALAAAPLTSLTGQVAVYFSMGARYNGTLVHDSIVQPFDVRTTHGLAFTTSLELPTYRHWSAGVMVDYSRGMLQRHDRDGATVDLYTTGTLAFGVTLRRELSRTLGVRLTTGGLRYLPSRKTGIFQGGAGELYPLVGVALDWAPVMVRVRGLAVELRADSHRFLTQALRDEGFDDRRNVHRVTIAIRADLARLR